jgi:thiamine-phosphate pyrophosphorylase
LKLDKDSLLLYAVTDRQWLGQKPLAEQVETAVKAGATMVQLREKNVAFEEFVFIAEGLKKITEKYGIPFIINDNVDAALLVGADGVHVGQQDMGARQARRRIGPDKILGVSVQTVEQAISAENDGADYIGVGTIFPTSTKSDANAVSKFTLAEICRAVSIPAVAIGGISKDNILSLSGSGVKGVAVVSAIFAQQDIYSSTMELRRAAEIITNVQINH